MSCDHPWCTDDLMTPTQVAEAFQVNRHTVARWARERLIPVAASPAGKRRYRRADVEKLLEEHGRP